MRKKGRLVGYLMGMNFAARINEVSFLVMLQKIKDTEEWKAEGFDAWKDFVREATGSSYETINNRLSEIKKFGPEMTSIMVNLGLSINDVKMIEHAITDDPKTGKKVIKIDDDKIIPFTEDRIDEIQSHLDILKEKEKLSVKKLSGVEKEHKKEVKAMQEEVERLSALIPKNEEDREWAEKYIPDIDKAFENVDDVIRTFAFNKKVFSDPVLQAKILGIHTRIEERFKQFVRDFDAFITEENE